MNSLAQISPRTGTVAFGQAPRYGAPQLVEMPGQCLGRDSSGNAYVYQRRADTRCLHRLQFQNISAAVLDDLIAFQQTAQGCKYDFTWTDHQGGTHLVRFPRERLSYKETAPDLYTIGIGLEESIRMALIDETGTVLIDENGNVLTW